MNRLLLFLAVFLSTAFLGMGQVSITPGSTITQNFDELGTSATAAMPTGWKVDKNTTVRLVGTYAAAASATERVGGDNMSTSAGNGIYNYGAGDQNTATERAVGFISSGSATKSGNVYVQLQNNGTEAIPGFTISYDVEKYRKGNNAAGFSITMYYSTDGASWTQAGEDFITGFPADADNTGYTPAPGVTVPVVSKTLTLPSALAAGSQLYLAWNYSVTSTTTTSNAQALGIDDVSIVANAPASDPSLQASPVSLSDFLYNVGNGPSESQSFSLTGANLTPASGNITVTPTTNFEVSINNTTFLSGALSIAYTAGTLNATNVYVRLAAGLSAGDYTGTVTAAGGGATNATVALSGSVSNPATHLGFDNFPATGMVGQTVAAFSVEALTAGEEVDPAFTGDITLSKSSGPGNVTGTLTAAATEGVAYFNDITFSAAGTYVLQATATGLTAATSSQIIISVPPTFTANLLPQYMSDKASSSRVPMAYRATVANLQPNTTYRYMNSAVIDTDAPTYGGVGVVIFVNADGTFTRTTTASFTGIYGEFTTDASGSYTGWFMLEPSGNNKFTAGTDLFMRIRLNDGAGGTAVVHTLTTTESVKVLAFGTDADVTKGSAIRAISQAAPKNFAALYDNTNATGRPLWLTSIETTGVDYANITNSPYAPFYKEEVSGIDGAWGGIIPNVNANGVRRVDQLSLANGSVVDTDTSVDGVWGTTDTRNPSVGIDPELVLDLNPPVPTIAVNPASLSGFNYAVLNGPSASQSYVVSGHTLTPAEGIVVITPATNYELSLNNTTFSTSPINLAYNSGTLAENTIYVRLKAGLAAGNYQGNIVHTGGSVTTNLPVSGIVSDPANHLAFVDFPSSGYVGQPVEAFEVHALNFNNQIDASYTGDITLVKVSGIGSIGGTLTATAVEGVATFADITFSAAGSYMLQATASGLNSATSSSISITEQLVPQITSVILPQYMNGNTPTGSRIPFAFRAALSNLTPNATYRYLNSAVISADGPTTGGAGVLLFVNADGTFTRVSTGNLDTPGQYGEFTTNASGSYTGWFMLEATGNDRFTPGNEVFMRLRLNAGDGTGEVAHYLTLAESTVVLQFGTSAEATHGTALRAVTEFSAKNFAFLYDNTSGTGRPLAGTSVETTGIDFTSPGSYALFYTDFVEGNDGNFGTIVPNVNTAGVQRLEERGLTDGQIVSSVTSTDGVWGTTDTKNPVGGLTDVLVIDLLGPLPATHLAFNGFPASGTAGDPIATFTVEALNDDDIIAADFTGAITLEKVSGAGDVTGTLTVNAVAGVATFTDIVFSEAGNYVLEASADGLLSAESTEIEILAAGTPLLSVNPASLSGFTYVEGNGPSASQSYTVSGTNLTGTGNITATAGTGFEVSLDNSTYTTSVNMPFADGVITGQPVTVHVRMQAGLDEGTYSDLVLNAGGGASGINVVVSGTVTSAAVASLTEVVLPIYMQGMNGTNNTRVPLAYRAQLSGLSANATYRYYNKVIISSDNDTYNGAGNSIFVNGDGTFVRTTSTSLGTPGQYGEFTTDATGSWTGWFITEPSGNDRFTPGNQVYMRINLNDGNGGTTEATRLTTTNAVTVINFGTEASATQGTAIHGASDDNAGDFVFLYATPSATRPLFGTHIESTGIDFAASNAYAPFYTEIVQGVDGSWGGIVPNVNTDGVQYIRVMSNEDGTTVHDYTDNDAVWSGTDTKNPTGGLNTPLYIYLKEISVQETNLPLAKIWSHNKSITIEPVNRGAYTLTILNLQGMEMSQYNLTGHAELTVQLPTGIYIVRLTNSNGIYTNKVYIR